MENDKKLIPLKGIEKKSLKKMEELPAKDSKVTSNEEEELHLKANEILILAWINPFC